ncbi:hypothetical protein CCDG5_0733 [[Clostridium] cellulosi]|uniref:Uncharacterized protein n=1 Tax=[Clostridium] cellulosi TaxID=29343 RepID=A0A078KMZ3_9FIRM|nr:hypothetical protein CCDG5_0733 [[Clostridium] cellulosi]
MSKEIFHAGEKVKHPKFGQGFIRILKPFEKSFVEFIGDNGSHCEWVKNTEIVKAN